MRHQPNKVIYQICGRNLKHGDENGWIECDALKRKRMREEKK